MPDATNSYVFYADVLGFSAKSTTPGAAAAKDVLEQLAWLLSDRDPITRHLQHEVWDARFALSDSLVLVGGDPVGVCSAATDLFYNVAYVTADDPILLRGAISYGEVHRTEPVFPETSKANLVGPAVVDAVRLERSGRGPRLFLSADVANRLLARDEPVGGLVFRSGPTSELLWMLSSDPIAADPKMIATTTASCRRSVIAADRELEPHAIAHLRLVLESLKRCLSIVPDKYQEVVRSPELAGLQTSLKTLPAFSGLSDELATLLGRGSPSN